MEKNKFPCGLEVQLFWGEKWRFRKLIKPFVYKMSGMARSINVPAGFVTDFASVPRLLWALLPPWEDYGAAAVIHDFLYSNKKQKYVPNPDDPEKIIKITRKVADKIFLRAMKDCSVGFFRRWAVYSAVRAFGWASYEERSKHV